jgi:hypothetical protein
MPGNNTSEVDSTHCVSKSTLFSGHNDVVHIGEEILSSLDEKIKVSVDCSMLGRFFAKIHFAVEFQAISNIFLLYFLAGSTIEVTSDIRHTYTPQAIVLFCCSVRLKLAGAICK